MKRIPPVVWLMASMLLVTTTVLSKNLFNETNFTNPNLALGISIDSFQNVSCAGGLDGFAIASASGGVEPYIYLWSNGTPTAANLGLSTNVYSCTVTDFLGATAEASITISEPSALSLSTLVQVNIDCINATGSAEVEATGGTQPYTYNWSHGATGSVATGLATGTYTVTVTDDNGCLDTEVIIIVENLTAPIAVSIPTLEINCQNPTVTLNGTGSSLGNFAYLWTTIDGNIVSGAATLNSCVADAAGTYTLTVTDNVNGCTATADCVVTENITLPTAHAGIDFQLDCLNPTAMLDGSLSSQGVAFTYLWTTLDGNIVSGAATLNNCLVDAAGTYTLEVTDILNGCTATDDVSVTLNTTQPNADAGASLQIDCLNPDVTLDGSASSTGAGILYLWTTIDGNIVSGATTLNNCIVDAEGTYSLLVTDSNNGCTQSDYVVITEDLTLPTVDAGANLQIDCNNATVTFDGSTSSQGSNYSYLWTTTTGNIVSGETTLNSCVADAAGTYSLTINDSNNGCTSTDDVDVTVNLTAPIAEAGLTAQIDCINPTVILNGVGSSVGANITYNWTTVDGNITAGANTLTPTCDQAGTYTLTVTDISNGCTASDDVVVTADVNLPTANAAATVQIDCNNTTVTLDGSGSSTGVDFGYLWTTIDGSIVSGSATLNNCVVDAPGTYTLTVTSLLNGCTADADAALTSNTNVPTASATVNGQIDCNNSTLVIDGSASSQGSNIIYLWTTVDGNIVSGGDTHSPTVDASGTYLLTVTDNDNGCTSSTNANVSASLTPPIAEAGVTVQIDCINPTVILNGVGSSIGANITYNWTTIDGNITAGANTLTPTCDQAGTYTLTVTDISNGCTASDDMVVTADVNLPTANAAATVQIDCNNTTVTLDGSGSSTGVDFGYLWTTIDGNIVSGSATLNNCVVDAPGTYTLTVTSLLNGCTADADAALTSNTNVPTASATVNGQIDCSNSTLVIDGSASSQGSNIIYLWTTVNGNILSGEDTHSPTVDAAGTYTLLVTDNDNGCTSSTNANVTLDMNLPTAEAGATAQIDCINSTVILNGAGSSIGANISYLWTTVDGNIVSGETTLTPTCDQAGTYVLEVLNSDNGCTSTDNVVVTVDTNLPAASASVTGQIDCNTSTLTLDGSGSAVGAGISYNWTTTNGNILSGANTLNNCVVDASGTYTLTVTVAATGCSASADVTVTADLSAPTASASVNANIDCNNASVTLDGSGSSTGSNIIYLWTTVDGNISAGANSINATATAAGTYTLSVTDNNNGCTAVSSVVVIEDLNLPTAEAGGTVEINCNLPSIMLNGAGSSVGANITYLWTTIDGNITAGATTLTPTCDAAGTYTLTVTDGNNGCTASDDVVVTADLDIPNADASVSGQIDCLNANLTLDGSGSETGTGIVYLWTTLDGNIVSGATTLNNCVVDAGGTYNLLVTNSLSGCTADAEVTVNSDLTAPTASASVTGQLDCLNASLTLDGSGSSTGSNFNYLWTTVTGNIQSGATTLNNCVIDAPGIYTLEITDTNNGCTATANVTVTEDLTLPTAEAGVGATLTCALPTVMLNGAGSSVGVNISYLWTTVDGNITAGATTLTPTVGAAGTYNLTVTNTDNGCTASDDVAVTADVSLPTANANANADLNCNNATVTLDGTGSSTGGLFTYLWTTTNGNIVSGSTTLNNCVVDAAGDYTLTITNTATGCTATASATVILNDTAPTASASVTGQIDCLNASLIIDGSASSQGSNIVYLWTTVDGNIVSGEDTDSPTVDAAGTYTLSVTDNDNGCNSTTSAVVTADTNLPTAEAGVTVQIDCANTTVLLNGAGSSVGANITYLWTTVDGNITAGETTLTPTVDAAGTYTLTVSDSNNGCESSDNVAVTLDVNLPNANASVTGQLDCNNSNLTLDGSGSATGSNIVYLWTTVNGNIVSGATTLNNCVIDAPGNYNLLVTNSLNGCSASSSVNVTSDTNAPTASATVNGQIDCLNANLVIDGSASSQGSNIVYLWTTVNGNIVSGEDTDSPTVDAGGTYTLTVTDNGNGCSSTSQVTVTANTNLPTAEAGAGVQLDCINTNATLNGAGSSAGVNISYLWTTVDGNITAGETTLTPTIDAAGTYTLTVTNSSNGCTNSDNVVITVSTDVPNASASVNADIDCLNASVTLDGTGSETGAGIVYLWTTIDGNILSGSTTLNNCVVDAGGTYTLTVTNNSNSCTESDDVEVTVSADVPSASASVTGQIDCLNSSLTLDGTGSETGANITYLWTTIDGNIVSGSTTLNNCIVDAGGTYTLTVTNTATGCTGVAGVTVISDTTVPTASASVNGQIDCTNASLTLNGSGSSTGGNITYLWTTLTGNIVSGETTLNNCVVDASGIYTLTVTDNGNGCVTTTNVTVIADTNLPTASAGVDAQLDCVNTNATLNGTGSSVGANMTYLWTTVDGNIVSGETTLTPVVDAAGTYTLTVTNSSNGCTNNDNVQVTLDDDLPAAVASANGQLDCINSNLTLSGAGSATGAGITYLWTTVNGNIVSGGNTLNNCVVDAAGIYTLTVTDANSGCSNSASVAVISDTNEPTASAVSNGNIDCINLIVTLDGSASSQGANISYQWTTLNGNILSGGNTAIAEVDAAGLYTLTVTDNGNGCVSSTSIVVIADLTEPVANAGQNAQLDCANTMVTLDGTGSSQGANFKYEWTTVGGNIVSGGNTLTPVVNAAGIYTLTVFNLNNGCSNFDQIQVIQSLDFVNAVASVNGQLDCNNSTLTLNGNGSTTGANITYLWTTVDGNIVSGANTLNNCVVDSEGTYTLTVMNTNSNCSNSADVTVTANTELPNAQAVVNGAIGCLSQTAILDGTGSSVGDCLEYEWTTIDGNIVSGHNSITAIADAAGTYILTVTNTSTGMTDQVSVEVDEIAGINIELTAKEDVDCFGNASGSATVAGVNGSLPYTYLWSNGATTATISNVSAGIYTVIVTDANGCTNTLTVEIEQPDILNMDVTVTHETGTNANDGTATVSVTGGTPPYHYLWSNGATTSTVTDLAPGDYSVTVTDANGCEKVVIITINPHGCESISIGIQGQNPDCANPNGGSATATAMGGTGDFTFEWSNGQTGPNLIDVSAGTYLVIATDENGCTASASITLELPDDQTPPSVTVQNTTIYLDANGNAILDISDVVLDAMDNCGDVTIDIDTTFNCANIGENIITITVTDQAGNVTTATATITVVDDIAPVFTCPDDITVNTCDGPVYYEVPGLQDNCDEDIDMILIEGKCPGSVFAVGTTQVTYAATDASGNIMSCTFDVTVQSDLELDIQIQEPTCHDFEDATATVDALNGNINDLNILWTDDNHQTTATADNLAPGNYTVLVVDNNNCLVSENVTIPNPPELLVEIDEIIQPNSTLSKGSIYISIFGGKAPYHVEWTKDGTITFEKEDLENVLPGIYTAMITDANGCTFWIDEITLGWEFQVVNFGDDTFKTSVFPSPTTGRIFLQIFQKEEAPVSITIFNFIGQQVLHRDSEVMGTADFDFDLTGMPSGQYSIRFNVDGRIENKNFVLTSW